MEDDQRALVLDAELLQYVFCRVEIDIVDDQIRFFLLDLLDDRPLLFAGRTPGRGDVNEDGFVPSLCGLKCGVVRLSRPSGGR